MNPPFARRIFFVICLIFGLSARADGVQTEYYGSGYFRGGLGVSEGGGLQTGFKAPGAQSKYRLGNETDNYIEAGVGQLAKFNDTGRSVNTYFMIAGGDQRGSDIEFKNVAQLFVEFKGFLGAGTNAWIGRKYYRRNFVNMLDHAWINPGQGSRAGAGLEGIGFLGADLNVAVFQYEDRGVAGIGTMSANSGTLDSTLLDVRFSGIELAPKTNTTVLLQGAAQAANENLEIGSESGYAAGAWIEMPVGESARNVLFSIYRKGSAVVQGDFNGAPVRRNLNSFSTGGYDLDRNFSWEINDTVTAEKMGAFSLEATAGFRKEDFGRDGPSGGSDLNWYTAGVRPVYQASEKIAHALEAGYDHVEDRLNGRTGDLMKLTLAEELKVKSGYFERPVLRFFVTGAAWSNSFKGILGNNSNGTVKAASPYANRSWGWVTGFQVETWW